MPISADAEALIANLRAYIKLVYPAEITPHAKRILEQILEEHERGIYEDRDRQQG
jgi:hypothetical protein